MIATVLIVVGALAIAVVGRAALDPQHLGLSHDDRPEGRSRRGPALFLLPLATSQPSGM